VRVPLWFNEITGSHLLNNKEETVRLICVAKGGDWFSPDLVFVAPPKIPHSLLQVRQIARLSTLTVTGC
jgi:hypothetical protein